MNALKSIIDSMAHGEKAAIIITKLANGELQVEATVQRPVTLDLGALLVTPVLEATAPFVTPAAPAESAPIVEAKVAPTPPPTVEPEARPAAVETAPEPRPEPPKSDESKREEIARSKRQMLEEQRANVARMRAQLKALQPKEER